MIKSRRFKLLVPIFSLLMTTIGVMSSVMLMTNKQEQRLAADSPTFEMKLVEKWIFRFAPGTNFDGTVFLWYDIGTEINPLGNYDHPYAIGEQTHFYLENPYAMQNEIYSRIVIPNIDVQLPLVSFVATSGETSKPVNIFNIPFGIYNIDHIDNDNELDLSNYTPIYEWVMK